MAINTPASFGSIPQHRQPVEAPGWKALFHSERELALIVDKTILPGYGVLRAGTLLAVDTATLKLYPYPVANADENPTNAKAYILEQPSDADTELKVTMEDSYKFPVGSSLILDGASAAVGEIQSIALASVSENDEITVSHGDDSVTATVGSTETLTATVALLQAAEGYGDLPFTITEGTNALTLTWKVAGAVDGLASMVVNTDEPVAATQTQEGVDQDEDGTAAEDLGAIVSIDRTTYSHFAVITVTTGVTTGANFTLARNACVYLKGVQASAASPFTAAKFILDKDVDTGVGANAEGGNTSILLSNAILNYGALIGLDANAVTALGVTVDNNHLVILK